MALTVIPFERGSNISIPFVFRDGEGATIPLAGSQFIMTLIWPRGGTLTLDTAVDTETLFILENQTVEPEDGVPYTADQLVWNRTLTQSRLLPLGNLTRFEFERRIDGLQEPFGMARFEGQGGLPPDE